ncbi:MAG: hypothetical protein R2825_21885 [Saprospiraceae bacterium]
MKSKFLTSILFAALFSYSKTHSVKANLIPVTSIGDNLIGSLRLAVATASPGDTIMFDASLDGMTSFSFF